MSVIIRHVINIVFLLAAWIGFTVSTLIFETLWLQATALLGAFVAFAILVMLATTMLFYDDLKDK